MPAARSGAAQRLVCGVEAAVRIPVTGQETRGLVAHSAIRWALPWPWRTLVPGPDPATGRYPGSRALSGEADWRVSPGEAALRIS